MTPSLDMHAYVRLGQARKAFDQWLRDEGLVPDNQIVEMVFGEGYVQARCISGIDGQVIHYEWKTLPVKTLPPAEIWGAVTSSDF